MKISSEFVGTPLKEYKTKIDWRHTMNYAAAVEDNNPLYFDDENDKGIVAPPMFYVAVTWPIIENLPDFIESEDFPKKVMRTIVHHTEHMVLHRLIKPDDELTILGEVTAILPHRAGTQAILRLDARDNQNEIIFTEFIGAMLRGVKCIGEGRGQEKIPQTPKINKESYLWKSSLFIDDLRPFIYDGCTNIVFPIHTSKKFARFVGLPNIIVQGTATLAYTIKELTNRELGGNPYCITEMSCKFSGMVLPGTSIEIQLNDRVEVNGTTDLFFEVFNNESKKAISNGWLKSIIS